VLKVLAESSPQSGEIFIAMRLPHHLRNQRNAKHFADCGKNQRLLPSIYITCLRHVSVLIVDNHV